MTATMTVRKLGAIAYVDALDAQHAARERVQAGGPDELLLLEHDPPVVTLGRRGGIVDRPRLEALETEVIVTDRGGLATWHGPGQLVGYPIVNLARIGYDVGRFVRYLGGVMKSTAEAHGVDGVWYDDTRPGIYVANKKLGSIGLHIHRGVTTHGFALNVDNTLDGFAAINPCGDAMLQITTVRALSGRDDVDLATVTQTAATLFVQGL